MTRACSMLVVIVLAASACRRDPGRDVVPMSRTPSGSPSSEIIAVENVAKSQPALVGQRVANTDITLTYSRPVARGRAIFGGIVPYDAAWNPGADRATAIEFTREVQVNGRPLAARKYSLWMIPRRDRWTVIFSNAADVFHIPYPGDEQDALRLDVTPTEGPHTEVLTFEFSRVEGKEAELAMRWGTTVVPLSIRVP
jgi:hypothetical protein